MYFLISGTLICVIISNRLPITKNYELFYKNLPQGFNGFKIIQLSDLHNAEFGKDSSFLIKEITKHNPDIVVFTGDMIDSQGDNFNAFFSLAKAIANKYNTYSVIGNHEQALPKNTYESFINTLKKLGVIVLNNESITIRHNTSELELYGMWFNLRYYSDHSQNTEYFLNENIINEILCEKPKNKFTLLLTHNPLYFNEYCKWGADLILCGHMHGGMIRLPFLGGVFSPDKTYFPQFDGGLFNNENHKMIVSRGLGNGDMGFRLFNRPEIVKIVLKNEP